MQASQTLDRKADMPIFSMRSLLHLLWVRANPNLTHCEMKWVADEVPLFVETCSIDAEVVLMALGCLIGADGYKGNSGSFQSSDDLPSLLYAQARQSSLVGGLMHIAGEAAWKAAVQGQPVPGKADACHG